jgi:hypothetical protein
MDEIDGGKGKTKGWGLLAVGALVVIVTIGCNKDATVQSRQSVPAKAIIRVGLFDERAKSARRTQLAVRLANSDEWYPDLAAGGASFDFTVAPPSSDTLFIFPLGIKHSPIRVPLRIPSDLCTDECARDASIDVGLDTDSLVATGATVVGTQAVRHFAPGANYADPSGVYISRTELGDKWPFTVDGGWVDCVSPSGKRFRDGNGRDSSEFAVSTMGDKNQPYSRSATC